MLSVAFSLFFVTLDIKTQGTPKLFVFELFCFSPEADLFLYVFHRFQSDKRQLSWWIIGQRDDVSSNNLYDCCFLFFLKKHTKSTMTYTLFFWLGSICPVFKSFDVLPWFRWLPPFLFLYLLSSFAVCDSLPYRRYWDASSV